MFTITTEQSKQVGHALSALDADAIREALREGHVAVGFASAEAETEHLRQRMVHLRGALESALESVEGAARHLREANVHNLGDREPPSRGDLPAFLATLPQTELAALAKLELSDLQMLIETDDPPAGRA